MGGQVGKSLSEAENSGQLREEVDISPIRCHTEGMPQSPTPKSTAARQPVVTVEPTVSDPSERLRLVKKATSRVKTPSAVDSVTATR